MSADLVFNHTITDPDAYQAYPPAAMPSLAAHSAEVLVADYRSLRRKDRRAPSPSCSGSSPRTPRVAWYESDDYRTAMALRTASTEGTAVLCDGFVMPG